MAEDAVAYVSIVPESKGVASEISRQFDGASVGEKMSGSVSKGFLSTVGGIGLGIVKVVGGAVAISGGLIAGLALKGGISRALDIQDAEAKLTGLGHNAASVTQIMGNALDSVKGTAYGLDQAATVAAAAVAAGIQPGKDLTQYLKNVADAATIANVPLSSMGDIFNTVQAGNKAYNVQLQQLSQQGIPIYQFLAKELGVTTDAVFTLASQGKISSAEFGKAIQDNIGGAALASGKTARGAWANVEASLSRLGAAFAGPLITAAPNLFMAIEGAVDRADKALQPFIGQIDVVLVGAMKSLAGWINKLDFNAIITNVGKFFTSVKGAFSGTSSAVKGANLGGLFGDILAVVKPMAPMFVAVGKGLGTIAGSVGNLIAAGIGILPPIIDLFAGALGFLKDNAKLIGPLIITIVSAMLLYKASQIAANIAALAMIPAYAARTAVLLASIPASASAASATGVMTAAVEGQKIGLIRSVAAWVAQKVAIIGSKVAMLAAAAAQLALNGAMAAGRAVVAAFVAVQSALSIASLKTAAAAVAQTAAQVASKVALVAGAVAIAVVTAAQWLWNAAMDANPIGIIILAIAALVAAIIFLVLNWGTVVAFLTTVWEGFVTWFMGVMNAFLGWWNALWTTVWTWIVSIWTIIVTAITIYINMVLAVITAVVTTIVAVWNTVWGAISSFFVSIWTGIVSFVTGYINMVLGIIQGVGATISAVWSGLWSGIVSFFQGAWNGIRSVLNTIGSAFGNAFASVSSIVSGAFNGVVSVIRGAINSVIDLVNGAIGAVNDTVGAAGAAIGLNIKIGKIPRLAEGGIIDPSPGGGLYTIGEGKYPEAVVPLSPKNLKSMSNSGSSDRPIYTDAGTLLGWIKSVANGEARLIWAATDRSDEMVTIGGRRA